MELSSPILIFILSIITIHSSLLFPSSSAQQCLNYTFTSPNKSFKSCIDLPYQNSHLHWTYSPSHKQLKIAYRATQSLHGWIAWAINPTGEGMIGSQALIAFMNINGSMIAYTTSITSYDPTMLPEELSFPVTHISAEYYNHQMIIYAVLKINEKNGTKVNHVWQSGSSVNGNVPQMHPSSLPHLQSMGQIDFRSIVTSK